MFTSQDTRKLCLANSFPTCIYTRIDENMSEMEIGMKSTAITQAYNFVASTTLSFCINKSVSEREAVILKSSFEVIIPRK